MFRLMLLRVDPVRDLQAARNRTAAEAMRCEIDSAVDEQATAMKEPCYFRSCFNISACADK